MKKNYEYEGNDPVVKEAKERYKLATAYWEKQWSLMADDFKMCNPDSQWSDELKSLRAATGRPVYATDRINSIVSQIVNSQRDNRPDIIVTPISGDSSEDSAKIRQGMIKGISADSKSDLARDRAYEDMVRGGLGFYRVVTEYEKNSFDQVIKVEEIMNPFSVVIDPGFKKSDASDITYAFITSTMGEEEFKKTYPDANISQMSSWANLAYKDPLWYSVDSKSAVITEYFTIDKQTHTLCLMPDGTVLDKNLLTDDMLDQIEAERDEDISVVKWYKIAGEEILEQTTWPGDSIPIICVLGEFLLDEKSGKKLYSGVVRRISEEQQMLNIARTSAIEMIAAAPKAPWVGPNGFMGDRKSDWAEGNPRNLTALEYEVEDGMGNPLPPPTRNIQEPPIQGIMMFTQSVENDIKSSINMYDPNMGAEISNQSGIAIQRLQQQGSVANFHYSDNMSRALRVEGSILLDLIPKIYTSKRVVRIIDAEEKHKQITVNGQGSEDEVGVEPDLEGNIPVYDLTTGRYDVAVVSGPSYQLQKQQNIDKLMNYATQNPEMMQVAGDLIIKEMDTPLANQISKRIAKTIPPNLTDEKLDNLPVTVQQRLAQDQQMIQELTKALEQETQLADKEQNRIKQSMELENLKMQAEIKKLQLQQEFELKKLEMQQQHQGEILAIQEQLEQMKVQLKITHDLALMQVKYKLESDLMNQEAGLEQNPNVNISSNIV